MPKYYSDMESPDDLIHKYATPPTSSSPISFNPPLHQLSHLREASAAVDMLPSSSPLHAPSTQHQRTFSTNSGYMRRAQLFGRGSNSSLGDPTQPSRGLERIVERRRRGLPSPESASAPKVQLSALQDVFGASVQRYSAHNLRGANPEPHLGNVHTLEFLQPRLTGSSPAISSEPGRTSSMLQIRQGTEDSGTSLIGDGYGPGPTLIATPDSRLRKHGKDIPISQSTAGSRLTEYGYHGSSAEQLRQQGLHKIKHHPRANKLPTPQSTGKLFGTQKPVVSRNISPSTQFSDDNISELSYIEPRLSARPLQTNNNISQGQEVAHRGQHRDSESAHQSYDHFKGNRSLRSYGSLATDTTDTMSRWRDGARRPRPPMTSASPPGDAFLLDLENDSCQEMPPETSLEEKAAVKDVSLTISRVSTLCKPLSPEIGIPHTPVTLPQFLELPIVTPMHETARAPTSNAMICSKTCAVVVEESQIAQQQLTISSIADIISQEPIARRTSRGLSFATANAIVYGCTTFAALRFIFVNIGQDLQSVELATEMAVAAAMALIVCLLIFVFGR